jgi:hypothetical protein
MKSAAFASMQAAAAPEARLGGERDDEPEPRRVIVVAEADPDANRVRFRVACPVLGLSPVFELARGSADGNPYPLYGRQAAEWCGLASWQLLEITVAQVTSGRLPA